MKCGYCGIEVTGYYRKGWLYYHRMPRFEIGKIEEDPDPRKFVPLREYICLECFEDIKKNRRHGYNYDFGAEIEIFDTKNL